MYKYKLTKAEEEEIQNMISYYCSIQLDVIGDGITHEANFLSALIKLKNLYNLKYKQ